MAIDWLNESDKYAVVALALKVEQAAKSSQRGKLSIVINGQFPLEQHWREWMGSIAVKHLGECNVFLAATMPSTAPSNLDAESKELKQRAYNAYVGLQLASDFTPAHKPLLILGGLEQSVLSVRSLDEFDSPIPSIAARYPEITMAQLLESLRLGENLHGIADAGIKGGHWRLFRTLRIYTETRTTQDIVERVHQYSRCIDGLILPSIGGTKAQFKSKTELFIGPGHHDLMGEIYDLRSADEHLNDNRYLEVFDRDIRLDVLKKELVIEHIARTALAKIVGTPALWPHFANHDSLDAFWKLDADARRAIWGDAIDMNAATAGFDPRYINDAELGRP